MSEPQRVLILGATSAIAAALARLLAADGARIVVAARDVEEVERLAADLRVRAGGLVESAAFEATDYESHPQLVSGAFERLSGLDLIVLAFGAMGNDSQAQESFPEARRIIESNYLASVSVLTAGAKILERQGRGTILVLTSVAGDRGRPSNYVYGSAKGAVTLYVSGLRARLSRSGVRVVTAKLGFVDTKMTYGRPGVFMAARPERIARSLRKLVASGSRDVVYLPAPWRPILLMIRLIPERIFKRLPT